MCSKLEVVSRTKAKNMVFASKRRFPVTVQTPINKKTHAMSVTWRLVAGGSRGGHLHMAELMSDGERCTEATIFTDAAAPIWIAHCA